MGGMVNKCELLSIANKLLNKDRNADSYVQLECKHARNAIIQANTNNNRFTYKTYCFDSNNLKSRFDINC